jgi:hypothetical protein
LPVILLGLKYLTACGRVMKCLKSYRINVYSTYVSRTFVKSFYNKLKGRLRLKNVTFNTSCQRYKFLCLKL